MSSTQAAIDASKNSLSTATLTVSDIDNQSDASASSGGLTLSSDMLTQGKYGVAKGVAGNALNNASESGSSSGETRSAVSLGNVTITDEAKQQELTGQSASETVASLNRDTANAHRAAERQDVKAMAQRVEADRAIKEATIKAVTALTDEAYRSRFEGIIGDRPRLISP